MRKAYNQNEDVFFSPGWLEKIHLKHFILAFYSRPNTLGQWDPTILNTHLCTCTAFALTVRIFDMASNPRYFTVNRIVTLVTRGHLANVAKVLKILNKMQINWRQVHFNEAHNYSGSMSISEHPCTHPSPNLKSTLRCDLLLA